MTATRVVKPLLPPGTYWCAVVSYAGGSGTLGVYGPYSGKLTAEDAAADLRKAGVHRDAHWEIEPLRLIDLGPVVTEP